MTCAAADAAAPCLHLHCSDYTRVVHTSETLLTLDSADRLNTMDINILDRTFREGTDLIDLNTSRGAELESASPRYLDGPRLQEGIWSNPESWGSGYEDEFTPTWAGSVASSESPYVDSDLWPPCENTFLQGYDTVQHHEAGPFFFSSNVDPDWMPGLASRIENSSWPHGEDRLSVNIGDSIDVLQCTHCSALFQGRHRKRNLQRHQRLKHRAPGQTLCHCENRHCSKRCARQDYRLMHYEKHHSHLAGISTGLQRSRSTDTYAHEGPYSKHGESGMTSPTKFDILEQNLHVKTVKGEKADSSPLYSLPGLHFGSRNDSHMQVDILAPNCNDRLASQLPSCDTSTVSDGDLHQADHNHNSSVLSCHDCQKKFSRPGDYRRHMKKHTTARFPCTFPSCGKAFYRMDKLRDHCRNAHEDYFPKDDAAAERFLCAECAKAFETQGLLDQHISKTHTRRFECHLCEKKFILHADLLRHKSTVHEIDSETSHCTVEACTFNCTRRDNLQRHIRLKHPDLLQQT